ncbi:hypothetical protein T265_00731 [Opisthorchis viverrini]|uniref:Uncharacterized protein n=1 Tax=Opisthorchis viverrini TaxID=6198 RepID=A0A075A551_OPIVI|nr:hypothetical protein T265_00731 [Opisthorchis viverrini]KER33422.1 hypothetical protein T265_00731 [Opisthorchis viverrini]
MEQLYRAPRSLNLDLLRFETKSQLPVLASVLPDKNHPEYRKKTKQSLVLERLSCFVSNNDEIE